MWISGFAARYRVARASAETKVAPGSCGSLKYPNINSVILISQHRVLHSQINSLNVDGKYNG